jgi:hypothetical protein
MASPSDSRFQDRGVRFRVVTFIAAFIAAASALIWIWTHEQPRPSPEVRSLPATDAPVSQVANDITNVPLSLPTGVRTAVTVSTSAAPRLVPDLSSNELALQARVNELEAQVEALQAQLTNSPTNVPTVPMVGTWSCATTSSCSTGTRQISISGSGTARRIHVVEADDCGTYDWGEAAFNDIGVPSPGQDAPAYPRGFAKYNSTGGEGGFGNPHRFFLIVTFLPDGIETTWVRWIVCPNCAPGWHTTFLAPVP